MGEAHVARNGVYDCGTCYESLWLVCSTGQVIYERGRSRKPCPEYRKRLEGDNAERWQADAE